MPDHPGVSPVQADPASASRVLDALDLAAPPAIRAHDDGVRLI